MCLECFVDLPRTNMHRAAPSDRDTNIVQARLRDIAPLKFAGSWFYYSRHSPYANLIRTAKYYDRPKVGIRLGSAYAKEILADIPSIGKDIDVFLPVPMHWRKELARGFNQAHEIATGMGKVLCVPVGDNLEAIRGHATQTRRSAEQRAKNIQGIFHVRASEDLSGLNVAIVDDVITTGTTATEAAKVLLEAGVASVSLFSLGITQG